MNLSTLSYFTQFGRVFPLTKNTKKPLPRWKWQTKSTDDVLVMNEWLELYPDANWALVPTRAFVVDVDTKNGKPGPESIEAAGGLPTTFTVRTPSGGKHFYFAPGNTQNVTSNQWLPGVDIRYGDGGYVVLPYSTTTDGRYEVIVDLDDLEQSRPSDGPSESGLTPLPDWITTKLDKETVTFIGLSPLTPFVQYKECNSRVEIRDQVKFMFFRNPESACIWNLKPVSTMKDTSQSGFEWQLALRFMIVGGTDEEVGIAYRMWCAKHRLPHKKRFYISTIPNARIKTAPYIEDYQAKQPKRRKHGTTKQQIIEAIRCGVKEPKAIAEATGLERSAVRVQLKRMTDARKLVRTAQGYAIPDATEPQDASLAA